MDAAGESRERADRKPFSPKKSWGTKKPFSPQKPFGASGTGHGAFILPAYTDMSSGGPFFRDIEVNDTGSAVNSLVTIGSNDDLSSPPQPHIQASSVTFNALAGITYYFAADANEFALDEFLQNDAGVRLNVC